MTTTADSVNGADGVLSLREAVNEANTAAGPTTIELAAASTYPLTLCGGDEDANAGGDLDSTGTQAVTVNGHGSTVDQTCAGERVVDQLDFTTPSWRVNELTITGGDNTDGAAVRFNADVDLTGVTVSGNDAATGQVLNSGGVMGGPPTIALVDSTVGPNTGTGIRVSNGAISLTGSTITQNTGRGVGATDGVAQRRGLDDQQQRAGRCLDDRAGHRTPLVRQLPVHRQRRDGTVLFGLWRPRGHGLHDQRQHAGRHCAGGGISWSVDQDEPSDSRTATITNSTVSGNTRTGPGGGMVVLITELTGDPPPAQVLIHGSTFSANSATGATGRGGGIYATTGEVRADNSTFSGNTAAVTGGAIYTSTGDVFLRHATVAGNSAPTGANIGTGEDLNSFGSIVAGGAGGGTDCAIAGTTMSTGYNVGGDLSCLFVAGPGNQTNVGDPQLAALGRQRRPDPDPGAARHEPGRRARSRQRACTVFTRGPARRDQAAGDRLRGGRGGDRGARGRWSAPRPARPDRTSWSAPTRTTCCAGWAAATSSSAVPARTT